MQYVCICPIVFEICVREKIRTTTKLKFSLTHLISSTVGWVNGTPGVYFTIKYLRLSLTPYGGCITLLWLFHIAVPIAHVQHVVLNLPHSYLRSTTALLDELPTGCERCKFKMVIDEVHLFFVSNM